MGAQLKILSAGVLSSIQDKGRIGYGGYGVPRSGAADPVALRIGNALVGNEAYAPAIEFRFLGPKISVTKGSVRLGLAANVDATVTLANGEGSVAILPWQSFILQEGDSVTIAALKEDATGYLTIEGGLDLLPILGSSSTYVRAGLGGVNGQNLQPGDMLLLNKDKAREGLDKIVSQPFKRNAQPIRIIRGPQDDYFSEEVIEKFQNNSFNVSNSVDRMGIRLQGDEVTSLSEKGNDLISDGIIPGAIQIPGDGQPIILYVDCQSVGGYPKIATVITADLPRLGQLRPDQEISFKTVELEEAQQALIELEASIEKSVNSLQDYLGVGVINLEALYQSSLVGGVVDARDPNHFPGHLE